MQLFKSKKQRVLTSLQLKQPVDLVVIKVVESTAFYLLILGITLIPIFNHGCHSSPHTDEELCLDVVKLKDNLGLNKKARLNKPG